MAGPATIDRAEFLAHRWRYEAGQHVTILGRTGSGKTWLAYQLLARTAHPRLPAINLIMKPRDDTAAKFGADNGFRRVFAWPPVAAPLRSRPAGWNVWPRHQFDPDIDDRILWTTFRAAILDSYRRGNRILFADEVAGLQELRHPDENRGLKRELETVWARGRSMGTGVWAASQRPSWISSLAYSSADHLFLFYEPDARHRKRFDEIGGTDAKMISDVTANLHQHHAFYIRRSDQRHCVITP